LSPGHESRADGTTGYSRDLAPGDLIIFGFLKQQIQGVHFPDRKTLRNTICRLFGQIDRKVVISVFLNWIGRLHWVTENGGEYANS
jgi:hypothetical protein